LSDNLGKFNIFTIFRFELGLGVNIKVVGLKVSFLIIVLKLGPVVDSVRDVVKDVTRGKDKYRVTCD